MADQNNPNQTAKADAPKAADTAPASAAPAAAARAADASVKAAAKAAPAARKARKPRAAKAAPAAKPARAARAKPARAAKAKTARPSQAAPARAARAAEAAVRTTTRIQNQGTRTMKNEANKIADRFQTVFGDVNERAQGAIERNTRFAEELTELGRGNVEALVASSKIAARGLETVGQEVAEYGRRSFEDASAALKSFVEVKSPADLFRLQGEFARAQFDGLVAETSKLSETMIKLAGEVAEPITNRYSAAAERVKNAVAA